MRYGMQLTGASSLLSKRIRCACPPQRQQRASTVWAAASGDSQMQSSNKSHQERCIGTLLWKACADALGSAAEGQVEAQVRATFPQGLVRYAHSSRPRGCYTDDTQMALALARSLVEVGHLDPARVSAKYAQDFEAWRGYGGTAQAVGVEPNDKKQILGRLKQGDADWRTISREYFPEGSFANGGAMRIAPLGLAYRHAHPAALRKAVEGALHCTHVHPEAVDGAVVIAAACAWLSTQPAPQLTTAIAGSHSSAVTGSQDVAPSLVLSNQQCEWAIQLLQELLGHVQTTVMHDRLVRLQNMFKQDGMATAAAELTSAAGDSMQPQTGSRSGDGTAGSHDTAEAPAGAETVESCQALQACWAPYLHSPAWEAEVKQAYQLSGEVFQIRAVDAVPMALYAFCRHGWSAHPAIACVAAIHYGGDTDTIAAMTGALLGATFGRKHLPQEWFSELENGHALGRDGIIELGQQLASLDVTQ